MDVVVAHIMMELSKYATSLLPVLLFLGTLVVLDSFKLTPLRFVYVSIGWGAVAAIVSMYVNGALMGRMDLSEHTVIRYVAPFIEELCKASYLIILLLRKRLGFLADAAIHGFAVGAGFALIENTWFLNTLDASSGVVWVIRGFGTAALHGATMVIFVVSAKAMIDRYPSWRVFPMIPGLALSMSLHSLYNHFVLPPLQSTVLLLVAFPLFMLIVFDRSERLTRSWIGDGWQMDVDLLSSLNEGYISDSPVGHYLDTLRSKFEPHVVADMLCLLSLNVELAMSAKGVLMAREMGVEMEPDPDLKVKLAELEYLERSIGRTGLSTLDPLLHGSDRHTWQRQLLRA
jgi:RsiW-degrading membrane proteinase PrsW (M82 family)